MSNREAKPTGQKTERSDLDLGIGNSGAATQMFVRDGLTFNKV